MRKLEKHQPNIFNLSFNPFRPTLSLARGTNRQFYCTGVIIYYKTRQLCFVSVFRQAFLGFEIASNFRDTSPLKLVAGIKPAATLCFVNEHQSHSREQEGCSNC